MPTNLTNYLFKTVVETYDVYQKETGETVIIVQTVANERPGDLSYNRNIKFICTRDLDIAVDEGKTLDQLGNILWEEQVTGIHMPFKKTELPPYRITVKLESTVERAKPVQKTVTAHEF